MLLAVTHLRMPRLHVKRRDLADAMFIITTLELEIHHAPFVAVICGVKLQPRIRKFMRSTLRRLHVDRSKKHTVTSAKRRSL